MKNTAPEEERPSLPKNRTSITADEVERLLFMFGFVVSAMQNHDDPEEDMSTYIKKLAVIRQKKSDRDDLFILMGSEELSIFDEVDALFRKRETKQTMAESVAHFCKTFYYYMTTHRLFRVKTIPKDKKTPVSPYVVFWEENNLAELHVSLWETFLSINRDLRVKGMQLYQNSIK